MNSSGGDRAASLAAGAEGDEVVGDRRQARVRDGNAVGVEAEVGDDLLGTAEGLLGVDDPLLTGEAAGEKAERLRIELGVFEGTGLEEIDERGEELAAEECRESFGGEEVVLRCAHPAIGVDIEAATGDDGMDVGMEPPSVTIPWVRRLPFTMPSIRFTDGNWT